MAAVVYRWSLNPLVEFGVEVRTWHSYRTRESGGYGAGIRLNGSRRARGGRLMPYLQGNIHHIQQDRVNRETPFEEGLGFSLAGGVDVRVTDLISLPLEAMYVGTRGDHIDDVSGIGLSIGLNFNF